MDSYEKKVVDFLNNGKFGESYTINRIVAKENLPRFFEIVKQYMKNTDFSGGWQFNEEYTKLKRIKINYETKTKNRGIYRD